MQYDNLSRITEYTDFFGNEYHYGYDELTRPAVVQYPNGILTEYSYDPKGRLGGITHKRETGEVIRSFVYEYDLNRNITRITNEDGSLTDYTYDDWNRLTRETWKNAVGITTLNITYSFQTTGADQYGDTGNICSKTVTRNGGTAETTTFTYDEYNKLTTVQHPGNVAETLTYNANGQLIQSTKTNGGGGSETTKYYWNDQGFLTKVLLPSGEPVEYKYDGVGRLVGRKDADGEQVFVQSGWSMVNESDLDGRRTYYTSSSAKTETNQQYFLFNHRGDTVLVADQSGSILNELYYEAYGKVTDKDGMPINLTSSTVSTPLSPLFVGAYGIRYDRKTELSYMRFRWYSIEHLRFIRLDFLMGINRFVYVRNNPLLYMDVSGLKETTINNYLDMQTGRTIRTERELSSGRYQFLNYDVIITPSSQHISAEPAGVDDFDDCFPLLDEKLGLLADPGQTIQAYIYADKLKKYHKKRTGNEWTRTWYSHWNDKYWHCLFSCLIAKRYDYDLTLEFGEAKEIGSIIVNSSSSKPEDRSIGPKGYCLEDMKANRIGARGGRLIRQNRYPKDCHHFCTERGYQPFLARWK